MDNEKLSIMKTQHTPGPWHVYRMGNYFGINSGSDSGMESTDRTIITFGDGDDDLCGVRGDTNEEMMANARLIAAAPELLEALQYCKKVIESSDEWWMNCHDKGGFDLDKIKSAIEKALIVS